MARRKVVGRKKARPQASAVAQLQSGEAAQVLRLLLQAHPDLRAEAERLAKDILDDVSSGDLAAGIEDDMRALDIDDLNERAGVHHGEYTDPGEAAWALLEGVVAPHLQDLRRLLASRRDTAARSTLRGILLALYNVRDDIEQGSVLDWAPDCGLELAVQAADAWRAAGRALPPDVLDDVPEWARVLARG